MYIARRQNHAPITIKEISGAEEYSQAYIEKILQHLRDAKIVDSLQGNQGGYVLAKDAEQISLKDVAITI